MAVIKSSATADELVIDPVSKAARVTLYNKYGEEFNERKPDKFFLPFNLAFTAALAANSYVWAMRNGGTKTITLEGLLVNVGFTGTAAATASTFEFLRFSGANPSGGTAFTLGTGIARKNTLGAISTLQDARFSAAAALTVTGLSFDVGSICQSGVSRSLTGGISAYYKPLDVILQPGEGLCIRASAATVVGDVLIGNVHWSET